MSRRLRHILVLIILRVVHGEPDLPLCPVNVQYFPQNLPMHCRMPPGVTSGSNQPPGPPSNTGTTSPPDYNSPPPNRIPPPLPFPVPPGFPGPIYPPPPIPLMPGPPPPHKLPVIVMPFYSPDPTYAKKKKPRSKKEQDQNEKCDSDTDTDSCSDDNKSSDTSSDTDTSSSSSSDTDNGFWKNRRGMRKRPSKRRRHPKRRKHKHRRHRLPMRRLLQPKPQKTELLTPLIQYVTKDGYVIYEKEISKHEAKDWLDVAKEDETKINFDELDEINKRYPGDGTSDSETELQKNKMHVDKQFKKIEQELLQDNTREVKKEKPKPKQFKKNRPKSRKEKFAAKIGTNVEALS